MDAGQTRTREKSQNSWADSCEPVIYDLVAFMSIGKKAGRGAKGERRESQKKGEKK